jgi:endonuclease YncB( thermonuclease family)
MKVGGCLAMLSSSLAWPLAAAADPCRAALPAQGETFQGVVTAIIDGDGLCVGHRRGGIEVRLGDFDAPERKEPGGLEAKSALSSLVLGREIACVAGPRSYDRVIGWCRLDGEPLGQLLRGRNTPEGGR